MSNSWQSGLVSKREALPLAFNSLLVWRWQWGCLVKLDRAKLADSVVVTGVRTNTPDLAGRVVV